VRRQRSGEPGGAEQVADADLMWRDVLRERGMELRSAEDGHGAPTYPEVDRVDHDDAGGVLDHRQEVEAEGATVDDAGARRHGVGPERRDLARDAHPDTLVTEEDVADPEDEEGRTLGAQPAIPWASQLPSRASRIPWRITDMSPAKMRIS
jgi:hypothetical protein